MNEATNIYDLLMRGESIGDAPTEPEEEKLGRKALGRKTPGDVVRLAGKDFIVLGREDGGVAVITKEVVKYMAFGRTADYASSAVRRYCNDTFYRVLARAIGADNILSHAVDLTADDGTGGGFIDDFVSLITMERYRRYRKYLPALGRWWWTATRVNADMEDYARSVYYVLSDEVFLWGNSDNDAGAVRPFCILNPALLLN